MDSPPFQKESDLKFGSDSCEEILHRNIGRSLRPQVASIPKIE